MLLIDLLGKALLTCVLFQGLQGAHYGPSHLIIQEMVRHVIII